MANAQHLLKDHGLRLTGTRTDVLNIFMGQEHALSHGDIEVAMEGEIDRVTLYRTLTSFLEKGLIHKVLDDSGSSKYALCHHECGADLHKDDHVHFKCGKCNKSECLTNTHIPFIDLPKGYQMQEANLLIEGICKDCS